MSGTLTLSRDRKVSPRGTFQESRNRWVPTVRNSFGLPAGVSCPGRTEFCRSCYGVLSEQSAGVLPSLQRNFELLQEAGTEDRMVALLDDAVWTFDRAAKRTKLAEEDRVFRIHWDGDFFSLDYARAWRRVILSYPGIQFWVYTRSFTEELDVVPILAGLPNLELYLSVDRYNRDRAAVVLQQFPVVKAALCADVEANARALLPVRSVACPENVGRVGLMTNGRGACVTCRLCPDGTANIRFLTTHPRVASRPPVSSQLANVGQRCANPECTSGVPRSGGRGRPARFCSTKCRLRVSYLRRRAA